MPHLRSLASSLLNLALHTTLASAQSDPTQYPLCPDPSGVCQSYGVDFQNQGSYFQNSLSTDNFTFVSEFSNGCQPDYALNILVDPNGDEYYCTNTTLTPALVPELSSCPITKNELSSGEWSILVLSNNGNCAPLAVERDFYLSAGPEQTFFVTPTVSVTVTPTPTHNVTATQTQTSVSTAAVPYTTWMLNFAMHLTITFTPLASTTTVRSYRSTQTVTKTSASALASVVTQTASCVLPIKATTADPTPTITPTLAAAAAIISEAAQAIRQVEAIIGIKARNVPFDGEQRIAERKARIARGADVIRARAPDPLSTTITLTNPASFVTSTISAAPAPTLTVTVIVDRTVTSTFTPPPATNYIGLGLPVLTTLPVATSTVTNVLGTTIVTTTTTLVRSVIVTVTTTPASLAASCTSAGGHFTKLK